MIFNTVSTLRNKIHEFHDRMVSPDIITVTDLRDRTQPKDAGLSVACCRLFRKARDDGKVEVGVAVNEAISSVLHLFLEIPSSDTLASIVSLADLPDAFCCIYRLLDSSSAAANSLITLLS